MFPLLDENGCSGRVLTVASAAVLAAISNTACGADITFAFVSVSDSVFAEQNTASDVSTAFAVAELAEAVLLKEACPMPCVVAVLNCAADGGGVPCEGTVPTEAIAECRCVLS